jgi:hypothetical protein
MKKNLFFVGIILAFIFMGCNKPEISCEIVKPSPNATFELGETIDLAVVVDVKNTTIDEVQIFLDGAGYDKKSFFPFNFKIYTKNMEKGTHTIRAVAIASSGAKSEKSVSFTLTKFESPDSVSFSDGKFPIGWKNEGWMMTSPGFDDNYAIRATDYYPIVSAIKTCDDNINAIEFYAKGNESNWYSSKIMFYIDTQPIATIETTDDWKKYSYTVPAGEHTFSWRSYSSDGYVYLDAIKFYKE